MASSRGFSRHAGIAALALVLVLVLVSCGRKTTAVDIGNGEVPRTTEYRGVYLRTGSPLLNPDGLHGTIRLSIIESPDVGPESAATIDSASVQIGVDQRRATYPARFDRSTGLLTVSRLWWLRATVQDGRFEGHPYGSAFIIVPTGDRTVLAYAGAWSGTRSSGEDFGRLGFLIDGSSVVGVAFPVSDNRVAPLRGTYGSEGSIEAEIIPGYTFTGITSRYAIFGQYEATLDGGRFGTWTVGPLSF